MSTFERAPTPLPEPSATGFRNKRKRQRHFGDVAFAFDQDEIGGRHPGIAHHPLGQRLVQRQRQGQRIGKQIRHIEGFQQRRHLGFARHAFQAFADIEHRVPALARRPAPLPAAGCRRCGPAYGPRPRQRLADGGNGFLGIEFGGFFLAIAQGKIIAAQVIGDPDTHASATERPSRIRIAIDLAFEIPQQQIIAVAAHHRIGRQLDLSAAARRIDAEDRRGIAGGVAAQRRR